MKSFVTIAAVAACISAGWIGIAAKMAHASASHKHRFISSGVVVTHFPADPARRDKDVKFHEARVKRDPEGAIGFAMLSGAYLARSRETDSFSDAVKSEQAARKSLSLRTLGNLGGQTRLVNSLLQQHRFTDALLADEKSLPLWGPEPTLNELHMDILIELGRYSDAIKVLQAQPGAFEYPSGKAVIAHLDMIKGNPVEALIDLQAGYDEMNANSDAPSDGIAWYQEKIGEALASMGKNDAAEAAFKKTATLYPRDYKAYANLCRIASGRGDWKAAVDYGNKSNAIAPMPDILALVGDAYENEGNKVLAEKTYHDVVALAGKPSGPSDGLHEFAGATGGHGHTLDRQYAMFCADHNRDLDGGYACALRELQVRQDVFAYDTLAWVCLKRGEVDEAKAAIDRALSQGTKDAQMFYHAGKIYDASKRSLEARKFYQAALDLNPQFNLAESQDAQARSQLLAQTNKN